MKYLAFKDDLLAYGVKGRKATNSSSVHFALVQESQSKAGTGGQGILGTASVALRSRDEDRLNSLDLCGTFYQGKVPRQSANEDKRNLIIAIASKELGVREATGNNDGKRVEEYLRYTNLGKGYEWCAAFVSFCYGQAGLPVPRNPWSPALFPKARQIATDKAQAADVFGIYGSAAKRINHVGIVKEISNGYLISIEGNSNDRVESRRRHLRTVYAVAEWVNKVNQ
ncbi:CHAP domain-containing protein [Sphingobacterium faecale]|uniref:CHAP domain-containing protein n=1 Tax=Sphingobacterium faecale TaxID=2803775 RepID=UPI00293D9D13|nr:CHAP domain-containing protein [Sphingobacterium faecale]